eukprot:SAG31_NODE_14743_length_789_cov_2.408696_2_plen_87_part_00
MLAGCYCQSCTIVYLIYRQTPTLHAHCRVPDEGEATTATEQGGHKTVAYTADLGTEADQDSVGGTEIQHAWTFENFLANVPCDILD